LLYKFQEENWNQSSAAKKMAAALPNVQLARLISQEGVSLYRLGGLIGNVIKVDPLAAKRFVEKLSEIDLSDLFIREDPVAKEKGFTKVGVVGYFLSKWLAFVPEYRERIVGNINDEAWQECIASGSCNDGFWLMWNVYVYNSSRARDIIQSGIGKLLLQKCREDENRDLYFPLLGVLHICGILIPSISLFKIDITEIKETVMGFRENKPHPKFTQLILSMVALKIKLSVEEFALIKESLDEEFMKGIQGVPDIQVRKALGNLAEFICA
jgi:hypothetical protein